MIDWVILDRNAGKIHSRHQAQPGNPAIGGLAYPEIVSRSSRPRPRDLVDWREESIGGMKPVNSADVAVAMQLADNLRKAIGDRSVREVGVTCGVAYNSVRSILFGAGWPDIRTVALLEAGLGVDLWPSGTARTATEGTTK